MGHRLITNTESPIVVVLRCVVLSLSHPIIFRSARRHIRVSRTTQRLHGAGVYRGDRLFLVNPPNKRYETGDITVYRIPGQDISIMHRVLETHVVVKTVSPFFSPLILRGSGRLRSSRGVREAMPRPENQLLLTKGDNNYLYDVELYQGLDWLGERWVQKCFVTLQYSRCCPA